LSTYVPDANVVVKWFVQENLHQAAGRLLRAPHEFVGPDFIQTEILNTFLKKLRQGDMREAHVRDAMAELRGRFRLVASDPLISEATELGVRYRRSAFDAVYLLVARESSCRWVTADRTAYDALSSDFHDHVLWVEDIPE
jgi:predicted nucleic acid-binding protein